MLPIRVYYEDTDCGGVVYYANYLRYFERGRTEFLRDRGISLTDCHDKGILFVVTKAEVEYLSPGRHNDLLLLDTQLTEMSRITMTFRHTIKRYDGELSSISPHQGLPIYPIPPSPIPGGKGEIFMENKREGTEKELVRGIVTLASVNMEGRPVRIPDELRRALGR